MIIKDWTLIKIFFLIVIGIYSLFSKANNIEPEPPIFIYPIVSFIVFLFGVAFFRGVSLNKKLTPASFKENPLKINTDPLPFYHLVMWSGFITFISRLLRVILFKDLFDVYALFAISFSIGVFFCLFVTQKYFMRKEE